LKSGGTKNMDKIPNTDSIKELAAFWDNHDITDYQGEFEEVCEEVFEIQNEKHIEIQLDFKEFEIIEKLAREKGISDKALLQEWIKEKLKAA
jgi:hypothetical protein